jgi:hypothetical protein
VATLGVLRARRLLELLLQLSDLLGMSAQPICHCLRTGKRWISARHEPRTCRRKVADKLAALIGAILTVREIGLVNLKPHRLAAPFLGVRNRVR